MKSSGAVFDLRGLSAEDVRKLLAPTFLEALFVALRLAITVTLLRKESELDTNRFNGHAVSTSRGITRPTSLAEVTH